MIDPKLKYFSERIHGHSRLYAARSADGRWVKVGFSMFLEQRLSAINHDFLHYAPFSPIGSTRSCYRAEQQLHRVLAPFRQRNKGHSIEIYPAVAALEQVVVTIVEGADRPAFSFDEFFELKRWCRKAAALPLNRERALAQYEELQRWFAARRAERVCQQQGRAA